MSYTQLHKLGTIRWVKKIKRQEKKSPEQSADIIEKVKRNDPVEFANYVETLIATNGKRENAFEIGADGLPQIDECLYLTEGHMQKMPVVDLLSFYFQLKELPIDVASSPYFWGALTLDLMKKRRIQPHWLVYGGSSLDKTGTDKQKRLLVRRVIRSFCAPGLFRGMPELFADCSLARAYWCGRLSMEIAKKSGCNVDEIENAVRSGCDTDALEKALGSEVDHIYKFVYILTDIWNTMAVYLAGKLTVLRETNVIAGMVLWFLANEGKKGSRSSDNVKAAAQLTGQLTSYVMLDFYPFLEAKKIIGEHLDENLRI